MDPIEIPEYKYFITSLETWLSKKGNEQQRLADAFGLHKSTISKYIRNMRKKIIPYEIQVKIAHLIGYSYFDFLMAGRSIVNGTEPPERYNFHGARNPAKMAKFCESVILIEKHAEEIYHEIFDRVDLAAKTISLVSQKNLT